MNYQDFREKVNLRIYDSKGLVLRVFSVLNAIVSLFCFGVLIYYYGFPLTSAEKNVAFNLIQCSFAFYIFRYLVHILYDFDLKNFFRRNRARTFIVAFLTVEGISYNIFGSLLFESFFKKYGLNDYMDFSIIISQFALFAYFLNGIISRENFKPWLKLHPAFLFMMSILILTLIGMGLLMLPEMSSVKGGLPVIDAFFTSVSCVSVTGLSTIDVSTVLTFKGQLVLLGLMKLGGLNIIAFGALTLIIAKFGVSIKYHQVIEDFVNRDSLNDTTMLSKIIKWSTTIEVLGAVGLFIGFGNKGVFSSFADRLYYSIFHSISAFNNAGFSIFKNGYMNGHVVNNNFVLLVTTALIFFGGFGMIYLFDMFSKDRLRERMTYPWKKIAFGTKISLYFSILLLFGGALIFYLFESNNTLDGLPLLEKINRSLFMSMTTRSGGLTVMPISVLKIPVLISFLFLMFVGASSGSTGGGIRTSSFAVIYASMNAIIRGKRNVELFHRTIQMEVVLKAYAILIFFVLGNLIGIFALSITDGDLLQSGKYTLIDLVIEQVSALSTVGLSTGLTQDLSAGGKFILCLSMWVGRVGTLTFAYLLSKKVLSKNYKYPTDTTMVG